MKHYECRNYLSLDCEKGMCAIDKVMPTAELVARLKREYAQAKARVLGA